MTQANHAPSTNRWSPEPITSYTLEATAQEVTTYVPAHSVELLLDVANWNLAWLLAKPGKKHNSLALSPRSAQEVVANLSASLMHSIPIRTWARFTPGPKFVEMFIAAGYLQTLVSAAVAAEAISYLREKVKHLERTDG